MIRLDRKFMQAPIVNLTGLAKQLFQACGSVWQWHPPKHAFDIWESKPSDSEADAAYGHPSNSRRERQRQRCWT